MVAVKHATILIIVDGLALVFDVSKADRHLTIGIEIIPVLAKVFLALSHFTSYGVKIVGSAVKLLPAVKHVAILVIVDGLILIFKVSKARRHLTVCKVIPVTINVLLTLSHFPGHGVKVVGSVVKLLPAVKHVAVLIIVDGLILIFKVSKACRHLAIFKVIPVTAQALLTGSHRS